MPIRRRALLTVVLLVLATVLSPVHVPAAAAAGNSKIMIVGDSISQGSAGDYTWRYRLWQHLQPRVSGLDFVGVRNDLFDNVTNTQGSTAYADANFDRDHNALWGNTLAAAMTTIQARAATTPDVMLVLLGINDLTFVSNPADTETSLRRFIANARLGKADVKFVLGRVLPKRLPAEDTTFAGQLADYNNRIAAVASQLSTATSPIVVAATDSGYSTTSDSWDGVHPNAAGEVKIAAAFADRLSSAYGIGAAYPRPLPGVPLGPRTAPALSIAAGTGQATLSWSLSPGATGYWVWMRNVTAGEALHRLPIPVPSSPWTAGLLVNGATYQFQLQTTKGDAAGVYSNTVSVVPNGPVPGAPTGFTVQAGNGEATLDWTPPAGATGAYIWQRNATTNEAWQRLPFPVSPPWTAGGLLNGATYQYQVQSVSGLTEGAKSAVVSVQPNGPAPAAPTGFTATAGNGQAVLRWTAPANATGAYVWMRNVTAGEAMHKLPIPVASPWTAGGLVNGADYEFKMQAVNGLVLGGTTGTVAVHPAGPVPANPANLSAAVNGSGTVTLSWSATANATGYYIWVLDATYGGAWKRLPYPVAGTSFTYGTITAGHTFTFLLQAVNGLQESFCTPLLIGCSNQARASWSAPWHQLTLGSTTAQMESNWCGPAAGQTALGINGVSVSQATLALDVDLPHYFFTIPYFLTSAMNARLGSDRYETLTQLGGLSVYDRVVRSVDNNRGPVILVVQSNLIPWGAVGEGSNWQGHYLVVYGYQPGDYNGDGPRLRVWDPASGTGGHEMSANDWPRIAYFPNDPILTVPNVSWAIAPHV
jgi:lysophospholipase L1-like esterase